MKDMYGIKYLMAKEYFFLLIKIDIKVRLGMENFIKREYLCLYFYYHIIFTITIWIGFNNQFYNYKVNENEY
jgi:hypothetical protein